MKKASIVGGLILAAVLLMQLIGPDKNLGEIDTPDDFIQVSQVPDTLARIFLNSCYDCHSNHTNYPFYGSIAPASWFLNKHIVEGKDHLNFSSWGIIDKAKKISYLDDICEECSEGNMPLKSYLLIHRSSALGPDEIEAICDWAEQEAMEIMNSE
ncbi:heme-binding domain-containing protein [Bacteroidota bacterium]